MNLRSTRRKRSCAAWMLIHLFLLLSFCCLGVEKKGSVSGKGRLEDAFVKKNGTISLTERSGKEASALPKDGEPSVADVMKGMSDATEFVKIGNDDILTWGTLRTHVDSMLKVKADAILGAAGTEGRDVRLSLYATGVTKVLRSYILTAVVAYEARKKGVFVPEKVFTDEMTKLKAFAPRPTVFQCQNLTNVVYMRAYADEYIRPGIKVKEEDVAQLIKTRHESNLSVPATNRLLKATLADVRSRLVKNEISFCDAVDEYSECTDCCADGGDCGTWEEDEDTLDPALKAVCFSIPTNVLSDVIETPEAFHLIKVTSRYVPTAKGRKDGEVSSVDVRHIQIDKWTEDPEFTEATARKHLENRMLKVSLRRRQYELLKTTPIKSVIPLEDKNRRKRPIRL